MQIERIKRLELSRLISDRLDLLEILNGFKLRLGDRHRLRLALYGFAFDRLSLAVLRRLLVAVILPGLKSCISRFNLVILFRSRLRRCRRFNSLNRLRLGCLMKHVAGGDRLVFVEAQLKIRKRIGIRLGRTLFRLRDKGVRGLSEINCLVVSLIGLDRRCGGMILQIVDRHFSRRNGFRLHKHRLLARCFNSALHSRCRLIVLVAVELAQQFALEIQAEVRLNRLLRLVHLHPRIEPHDTGQFRKRIVLRDRRGGSTVG